eukprot:gene43096-53487_t
MAELQELIALHRDDIFEGEIPDHFFEEVAPEEGVEILHDNSHVVGQVVNPAAVWTEPQIQLLNRLNRTMTKTNQNRKKLELENHLFKKNRPGKVGIDGYTPIYWNCDTPGCGGWAMTLRENPDDESDDINARLTSEHSNGLDGDTVFCRQVENCHVLTSKATQLIINMCLESNTNYQAVEDEVRALLQAYNPALLRESVSCELQSFLQFLTKIPTQSLSSQKQERVCQMVDLFSCTVSNMCTPMVSQDES